MPEELGAARRPRKIDARRWAELKREERRFLAAKSRRPGPDPGPADGPGEPTG